MIVHGISPVAGAHLEPMLPDCEPIVDSGLEWLIFDGEVKW